MRGILLMIVVVLGGCDGGGHDEEHPVHGACVLVAEQEPNDTLGTAQFLGDPFTGDCAIVSGTLFDPVDVDSYRVLVF
jgi:hypothetical protein